WSSDVALPICGSRKPQAMPRAASLITTEAIAVMRSRAVTDVASVALAAVAALGMLAFSASAQEEFPSKPVIFVAPGTIGGGSDTQARLAADAIDRSGIIDEPVAVINRGAGGSQEAYTFTKSKAGDPHYVLTA